jgi:hypothetical protein
MFQLLFICTLFNDAISCTDYIVSNDGIINNKLIGKDVEVNGHGLT